MNQVKYLIGQIGHYKGNYAEPCDPHPAAIALRAYPYPEQRIAREHCPRCSCEWNIPLDTYGEPDTKIHTVEILRCPLCGVMVQLFPIIIGHEII